ncbi:MAG: FAD-dependent oxidoreductase [Bradymonadaceae bacterium]
MSNVLIVGDGPGGLSAALLLAKNGETVDVFGTDETPMHKAMLKNYLGIPEMTGTEFQEISRDQVESFGAQLHDKKVETVDHDDGTFRLETTDGESHEGDYLVLATTNKSHQEDLGLEREEGVAAVDRNGRTSLEDCYAVGWATRQQKIQAIISAGDGAAAGVDILSKEKGEPFHDFDTV